MRRMQKSVVVAMALMAAQGEGPMALMAAQGEGPMANLQFSDRETSSGATGTA